MNITITQLFSSLISAFGILYHMFIHMKYWNKVLNEFNEFSNFVKEYQFVLILVWFVLLLLLARANTRREKREAEMAAALAKVDELAAALAAADTRKTCRRL